MKTEISDKFIEPRVRLVKDNRAEGNGIIHVDVSGLETEFRFGTPAQDLFKQIEEDTTMAVHGFLGKRKERSELKLKQINIFYHITEASATAEYEATSFLSKKKQEALNNFYFE